MNREQNMVLEFHRKFDAGIKDTPSTVDDLMLMLRYRIMAEELEEYRMAAFDGDVVEIADALGDMLYTVYGTAIVHGIDLEQIFAEIHRSNMTKQLPDKGTDDDGKIRKGKDYSPPELRPILHAQGLVE